MTHSLTPYRSKAFVAAIALSAAFVASGANITSVDVFASGTDVNATGPDSLTVTQDSVWVSYTNGADSTGASGSSTVVQYDLNGKVRSTSVIRGYVDGLKVDKKNGIIWALQNQDGNSNLTIIDPVTAVRSHETYAVESPTRGYDDVVFYGPRSEARIFMSYTNPAKAGDATIQLVVRGSDPIAVTPILTKGATGTNLATGQANQPTSQNDPDSLNLTPWGDLMLSSGDDGQLIFVHNPGTSSQDVSFLTLLDPSGKAVSGLDDAVFATTESGTFYLADTKNNRVLVIKADGLSRNSLFASVGSLNQLAAVDLRTGKLTAFLPYLNAPHGLIFIPAPEGDDRQQGEEQ